MAVITPQSDVYLLKVPLEIDEINQLTFSNTTTQFNYFNSQPKIEVDNFTYQRKDGTIRFPAKFDDVVNYNYVIYRNDAYSSKWFYAFVTGVEYLNDNVTAVSIKTDVFQTWQFDLVYKRTFVEREHVNDDSIGAHTVPEGLEVGEYVRSANGVDYDYNGEYWLAFQVTELISNMSDSNTGGRIYNGIYNGVMVVLVDSYTTADLLIAAYDDAAKADAIISCFYLPKSLEPNPIVNSGVVLHGQTVTVNYPRARTDAVRLTTLTVPRPTSLDGYTPKNNKMFTREFCYLYASNNSGVDLTYNFEDWRNADGTTRTEADFRVEGAISQGASIRMYPESYYKMPPTSPTGYSKQAYGYGIVGGKLPICSWNSDYYTNWLTQNSVNIGLDTTRSTLGAAASLITGNIAGATDSLLSGIGGVVAKQYEASLVPDQAKGNVNSGDINFTSRKEFTLIAMTVRNEYARICDDFMSMFGYKVNRVKIPNVTGRRNWNYVKTIGCYIEADIPQDDLQEIKSMFDKGVTFWHNPATFMDYSQTNDIV